MKLGIISDTHGYLNPVVLEVFRGVDAILHAGDVGTEEILLQLRSVAPVVAVRGNMDHEPSLKALPSSREVEVEGKRFFLIHDIGNMATFQKKMMDEGINSVPDIVVFGHTHQALYKQLGRIIYVNPGSATSSRDSRKPSVLLLNVTSEGEITPQLIELRKNTV